MHDCQLYEPASFVSMPWRNGNGITLDTANAHQIILKNKLQQANFKGDDKTIATLHNGPIKGFNIMIKV